MRNLEVDIFLYNNKMMECRYKYEYLCNRFDAAIISNIIMILINITIYIFELMAASAQASLSPILTALLLFVYLPVSYWIYTNKKTMAYIILAVFCIVLFFCFLKLTMLVFASLNVAYYFLTREIAALQAMTEYPLFLPLRTDVE